LALSPCGLVVTLPWLFQLPALAKGGIGQALLVIKAHALRWLLQRLCRSLVRLWGCSDG
jgi:hypothetical protein